MALPGLGPAVWDMCMQACFSVCGSGWEQVGPRCRGNTCAKVWSRRGLSVHDPAGQNGGMCAQQGLTDGRRMAGLFVPKMEAEVV